MVTVVTESGFTDPPICPAEGLSVKAPVEKCGKVPGSGRTDQPLIKYQFPTQTLTYFPRAHRESCTCPQTAGITSPQDDDQLDTLVSPSTSTFQTAIRPPLSLLLPSPVKLFLAISSLTRSHAIFRPRCSRPRSGPIDFVSQHWQILEDAHQRGPGNFRAN